MTTASLAFTSAGTTLSVSAAAPATYDLTGFGALTFTPIGEVTDIGTFGKVYTLVTHNPLGTRNTVKRKGSYNQGTCSLKLAYAPTDAGQAILKAAADSDSSYSFKVVLQNGTIKYFSAQTMSAQVVVGSVNNITQYDINLEIDNDILST